MGTDPSSTVIFVLSVVTSGYILACYCYAFRYRTAREAGHRLYLTCATLGVGLTLVSLFLLFAVALLFCLFSHQHPRVLLDHASSWELLFPVVSALNVLAAFLGAKIYNSREGVKYINIRRVWQKDDFSALLAYATSHSKLVAVTLRSRKVYVGLVARTNEPHWECSHITVLPFYSGFRRERDLKLQLTNRYEEVFDYFERESSEERQPDGIKDFYVVAPLSDIVSSHVFNPEIYKRLGEESVVSSVLDLQ